MTAMKIKTEVCLRMECKAGAATPLPKILVFGLLTLPSLPDTGQNVLKKTVEDKPM